MQCWSDPMDYSEPSLVLESNTPDLSLYNFDNMINYCCFNGIWILYDDYNYNSDKYEGAVFFAWGQDQCQYVGPEFSYMASSSRFAGSPDNYKLDTLNLYEKDYFMGEEQYVSGDSPVLKTASFGSSVIITGCKEWTLYEFTYYRGDCTCVFPLRDGSECRPGFYTSPSSLSGLGGKISSAKLGCYCSKNRYTTSKIMIKKVKRFQREKIAKEKYIPTFYGSTQ